jgi:hypothetical protein
MDRRFEPRHRVSESVQVSWPGGSVNAEMRDFSRSGASVASDRPIPVETTAVLAVRGIEVKARVVSCVRKTGLYLLGLELLPEFVGALKRKT